LGHATRSKVVADEVRRLTGRAVIDWCSSEPVATFLSASGERLLDCCRELESMSSLVERRGGVFSLKWMFEASNLIARNYEAISGRVDWDRYDYVVADEFWEVVLPENARRSRMVFVTDFLANSSATT
jgi:hypothetical protein